MQTKIKQIEEELKKFTDAQATEKKNLATSTSSTLRPSASSAMDTVDCVTKRGQNRSGSATNQCLSIDLLVTPIEWSYTHFHKPVNVAG